MPKVNNIGVCSVDGCGNPERSIGYCNNHYSMFRKHGRTVKLVPYKRSHPLYSLWWDRKSNGYLSDEWMDFDVFINDIGEKPEGDYFFVRIDGSKPYGRDNFMWQEHLCRKDGESKKDWWARKWQARKNNNPSMERKRTLRRRFGMTEESYKNMDDRQNGLCAICHLPETFVDPKTGTVRRLCLDHCHATNKIRELLCFRCNSTIGRAEDSIVLLQSMIAYITKHANSSVGDENWNGIIDIPITPDRKNYIDTPLGAMTVVEASKQYGIAVRLLNKRIEKGLSTDQVIAPVSDRYKRSGRKKS